MDLNETPVERMRELVALMEKIQSCQGGLGGLGFEEDHCASTWTDEELAQAEADRVELTRRRDEARAAFDALVPDVRVETEAERAAWAETLAGVSGNTKMGLVDALLTRPELARVMAAPALEQGVADPQYGARSDAWKKIIKVYGLEPYMANAEGSLDGSTELEFWSRLLGSDLVAMRQIGIDGLQDLVRRLQAGENPLSLGQVVRTPIRVPPELSREIIDAAYNPDLAYPVDEIAQLTGLARRQAEATLAFRLEEQDLRVPAALARLGATWTVPALDEAAGLEETSPEMREQIGQSLRVLKG